MNDKDKALKQALELIERLNMRGWILADFEDEVYATIDSLKAALEQQQAEPVAWNAGVAPMWPQQKEGETFLVSYTQQSETVAWDKPSASFDDWWDSDRRRDNANPFTTDSFSYWAFEGWQAALAQRTWVGLTEQDMPSGQNPMFDHEYFIAGLVYADKALKEKNNAA